MKLGRLSTKMMGLRIYANLNVEALVGSEHYEPSRIFVSSCGGRSPGDGWWLGLAMTECPPRQEPSLDSHPATSPPTQPTH